MLHRDLKPANIMVTEEGSVQIGDLGLARIFRDPLVPLWNGDKVVVTIWYRAPELLMGARHYTPAVDLWAVGCIFGELIGLRPMFKGEEAKADKGGRGTVFQRHQMLRCLEVLGVPGVEDGSWPGLGKYPEGEREQLRGLVAANPKVGRPVALENWFWETLRLQGFGVDGGAEGRGVAPGRLALDLMGKLLDWDPERRITAKQALEHEYFTEEQGNGNSTATEKRLPSDNAFEGNPNEYPGRRIARDGEGANAMSLSGTKRTGMPDDMRPGKRPRG